jgi:hypothetical protein
MHALLTYTQVGNHVAYIIDVLRPRPALGQELEPSAMMDGESEASRILLHLAERWVGLWGCMSVRSGDMQLGMG